MVNVFYSFDGNMVGVTAIMADFLFCILAAYGQQDVLWSRLSDDHNDGRFYVRTRCSSESLATDTAVPLSVPRQPGSVALATAEEGILSVYCTFYRLPLSWQKYFLPWKKPSRGLCKTVIIVVNISTYEYSYTARPWHISPLAGKIASVKLDRWSFFAVGKTG